MSDRGKQIHLRNLGVPGDPRPLDKGNELEHESPLSNEAGGIPPDFDCRGHPLPEPISTTRRTERGLECSHRGLLHEQSDLHVWPAVMIIFISCVST